MLWLQLAIIFVLILWNGFFAMAEMAIVSARKARLQHAADIGRAGARVALELKGDPGRFLPTVQIGITVINVLASVFGGAQLTESVSRYLERSSWTQAYAQPLSFAFTVIVISYFTLILGELVPKRIALNRPEMIASRLSRLLRVLVRIATPIAWLLSASSNLVLLLVPMRSGEPPPVTEEEVTLMLREATAAGHFQAAETAIVQMALRLGDRPVNAVMTPRPQVESLDLTDSDEVNRRKIQNSEYSRFPVVEGDATQVAGVVQVKDLLAAAIAGKPFDLRAALRPALFIPETVMALRALEVFKKSGEPMALVVDEYGDFQGLLTLHDILQSLVGDIAVPGDQASQAVVRRDDGSWVVDGMLGVDEVADLTGLLQLPGEETGDFHTLGGFIMARMNRIPAVGNHVLVGGFRFEVLHMDGRRVDKVLIVPPKKV